MNSTRTGTRSLVVMAIRSFIYYVVACQFLMCAPAHAHADPSPRINTSANHHAHAQTQMHSIDGRRSSARTFLRLRRSDNGIDEQLSSHSLRKETTRNTHLNVRGGAGSAPDPSRGFWSSSSQPTSFRQQSSSGQSQAKPHQYHNNINESNSQVTVTDVTNEMQNKDRVETKEQIDAFLTRDSRNSFIARVYAILSGQLLLVAMSVLAFGRYPGLKYWVASKGTLVPGLSLLVSTVTVMIMTLSERARQVAPLKWQLLALFSIAEAIIVGFLSSFYKSKTVMSAAMSTAVATMSVTMYTILNRDSKRDLSQWGAGLSSMGMIFLFYGVIHLLSQAGILPPEFLPYNESIYCFFGASLFSMYLAYHTRLIVSGKHTKYQLNEKDYVFGAVLLYNDIISIFLYMLRLMAAGDD